MCTGSQDKAGTLQEYGSSPLGVLGGSLWRAGVVMTHCGGRTLETGVPEIIICVGTQLHTSANRLPPITPRGKAPPTRGIRTSSTYQGAVTSPCHQEAPVSINFTHKQADSTRKRGYNPLTCRKETTQKVLQNEKSEKHESDEGTRQNPRRTAK